MNFRIQSSVLATVGLVLIVSTVAQAQSSKTKSKPKATDAPKVVVQETPKSYLEKLKDLAESELRAVTEKIKSITDAEDSETGPAAQPCELLALEVQKQYSQWFLDPVNFGAFEKIEHSLDALILGAEKALIPIFEQSVSIVPEGSDQKNTMTLDDAIHYVKVLNKRRAQCKKSPEQLDALMKALSYSDLSKSGLTPTEVIHAISMMANVLNANLQHQDQGYSIQFKDSGNVWDLVLVINFTLDNKPVSYEFSLLGSGGESQLRISNESKWAAILKMAPEINGYPSDAYLRYIQFQSKFGSVSCKNTILYSSFNESRRPYLDDQELKQVSESKGSLKIVLHPNLTLTKIAFGPKDVLYAINSSGQSIYQYEMLDKWTSVTESLNMINLLIDGDNTIYGIAATYFPYAHGRGDGQQWRYIGGSYLAEVYPFNGGSYGLGTNGLIYSAPMGAPGTLVANSGGPYSSFAVLPDGSVFAAKDGTIYRGNISSLQTMTADYTLEGQEKFIKISRSPKGKLALLTDQGRTYAYFPESKSALILETADETGIPDEIALSDSGNLCVLLTKTNRLTCY